MEIRMEIREAVSFYHLQVKYVTSVKFELSCTVASSAGTNVQFLTFEGSIVKTNKCSNVCFIWFAQLIIEIVKIMF